MSDSASGVQIGFLKTVPDWKLHHRFFPSKVGGFPAWLDLHSLPMPQDLQCDSCGEPTSFLLQVYAPQGTDQSFHRTIFLFACRKGTCMKAGLSKAVKAFRCSLPRVNEFYSDQPAVKDPGVPGPEIKNPICCVCGALAPNTCSSCKKSFYCSRVHQILAWRNGHRQECAAIKNDPAVLRGTPTKTPAVFAQHKIAIDEEILTGRKEEKTDDEKLLDYQKSIMDSKPSLHDTSLEELETFCEGAKDKTFLHFQKRVAHDPEQILRYDMGGKPLLISSKMIPTPKTIPNCSCGAARVFECQIMPQILNFLEQEETVEEGLDFGTVLVYTCGNNCNTAPQYRAEVAWVQLVEEDVQMDERKPGGFLEEDSEDSDD